MHTEFLFGTMKKFWKWTVVDGCTTVNVLNATELYLKVTKRVNFMLCVFYHNKKLEKMTIDK